MNPADPYQNETATVKRTDVTRWRSGSYSWGVDRYGWGWGWWAEDTATKRGTRSGAADRRTAVCRAEACARSLGAELPGVLADD